MTMNKILLLLIVASGFLLIFYANNDIFTRRRWNSMFKPNDNDVQQQQQQPQSDHHHTVSPAAAQHQQHQQHDNEHQHQQLQQHHHGHFLPQHGPVPQHLQQQPHHQQQHHHHDGQQAAAPAENNAIVELQAINYTPNNHNNSTAPDTEHNLFVIYTKENYLLRTKFELFMKSLLKYATVPLHLHIITDTRSEHAAEDIVRQQIQFYAKHPSTAAAAGRVQYSLYNVTEAAGRIADITAAMMAHFTVPGSHYADALFYVSLGLHRIVDPRMRRAILIDCDVVFRSDVRGLFEEFDRFAPENLFGLAPELTPVYYHILYKYRTRNPNTNFGKPYYPAETSPAHGDNDGNAIDHSSNRNAAAAAAALTAKHSKHGFPGLNSGVVMLNLERIRASKLFAESMHAEQVDRLARKYHFRGHLGDQDFYSLLGYEFPGLIYRLDCVWNRQLCTWWKDHGYSEIFDTFFHCEGKIRLYHGNCNTRVPE